VNEKVIRAKPTMTLFLDGIRFYTVPAISDHYLVDAIIPAKQLNREWVDLNIRLSAVAFHWSDPPTLMVALVYAFDWSEVEGEEDRGHP
jgi:hypothetical protein